MEAVQILDKVKVLYKLNSDKELANFLELKQSTLSVWRTRNTINYDIIFDKCKDVDLNVLIRGEVFTGQVINEPKVEYLTKREEKDIETLTKENQELKNRLEECRELVVRVSAGQRNVIYGGKVAATPPEED